MRPTIQSHSRTMPVLSTRAELTPASPIRKLAPLAQDAKRRGVKVFHLNIGQPDIKSPALFFEAVKLFSEKVVAYEGSNGRESLCKAWSKYMNATLGLATRPEHFLITTGGSELANLQLFCLLRSRRGNPDLRSHLCELSGFCRHGRG